MGFYSTISPVTGKLYDFEIQGDTPNEEELDKISNYIANDGVTPQETTVTEANDDDATFSAGIGRGVDLIQQSYGSALEGVGKTFGIQALQDYGAQVAEDNEKELEASAGSARQLADINDVGSFIDYMQVNLGQQLPNLAPSLAGGYAGTKTGAALGSFLGPGGTVLGGLIGGVVGATAANLPFFYGMNREAQKEEIEKGNKVEISEGAAALAAIPQATFDAVADRLLLRGFLAPLVSGGGLFTRGVKGAAKGIILEAPTEIGQQFLERLQAGKDLGSEEAIDEYIEVGVAAGLLGGTVRSTGEIIGGKRAANKTDELAQDAVLEEEQARQRGKNFQDISGLKAQTILDENEKQVKDAPVEQVEPFTSVFGKELTRSAVDQKVARETADPLQAARETTLPFKPIKLSSLPKDEALRIAQLRQRTGSQAPSADVTVAELETSVGPQAAQRERIKQKPLLSQTKALFERQINNLDTPQDISAFATDTAGVIEELIATNKLNQKNLTQSLDINNQEAADVITYLENAGYVKREKGRLKKSNDNIKSLSTKADATKARANDLIKEQQNIEKLGSLPDENQLLDRIAQEYAQLQENAFQIEKLGKKVGKDNKKLKASNITPDFVAKRTSDKAEKAQFTDEYKLKLTSVLNNLKKQLVDLGLKDIELRDQSIIENDASIEGYFTTSPAGKRVIGLAMDLYDPNLTDAQLTDKLAGVMNHELIHALKDMNFFTEQEYTTLVNAANKRKFVIEINGVDTTRKYTYMERAARIYQKKDDGTDYTKEEVAEEAIAEMYRHYVQGRLPVVAKPKTIFDKITRFIKAIFTSHIDSGFMNADDIFANITKTNVEQRIKDRANIPSEARSNEKYSTAGIVAGYIKPKLGNIERIRQSFKDIIKRIDVLEKAAKRLQNDEIGYKEYDDLVNDVKPIVPYETVPAPESISKMKSAISGIVTDPRTKTKTDKENLVGIVNETVNEGNVVGVRLDIPSYRKDGTWTVSIHGGKDLRFREGDGGLQIPTNLSAGVPLAYESTAVVTGPVAFGMSEKGALGIAAGKEKTTVATFQGRYKKATPDEAFAIAQEMMNDPNVVQIGMDPTRHSYFYDRMTTQPVISADFAVQIGPLVLARNPVFANKQDFKYSKISDSNQTLENRLLGFIKNNPDGFTVDPDTLEIPNKGFAVAPVKQAEMVIDAKDLTVDDVRQFAKNLKMMTDISGKKLYAGGWSSRGVYYLDATMVIDDINEALYTAEEGNQLAIFDLGEFNEIKTPEGVDRLKETGAYDSDARAVVGRNIRKLAEEFSKARLGDKTQQEGVGKKYSAIARARNTIDQYNRPLIQSTIVDEYGADNNIVPQPEYQTNPEKGTIAKPGRVLKIDALANHQKKRGDVIYDIHAKDDNQRNENRERVAIMLAAEAEKALQRDGNAIGWYGRTLDKTKKLLARTLYPDINKPDHKLAFDFALAVTSNGMGVIDNFGYAAEQYEAWVETGKFPINGWGDRKSAMQKSFKFYNSMIKAGATTEEFNAFMNQSTTVGQLAKDEYVVRTGAPVPSQESVDTPVNGSYIIGAKIGQGFYQNLIGNFDNLTQDIWFMRTINRLTGSVFKKPPTQKTLDKNYERVLLAIDGKKQPTRLADPITDNPLTDLDVDLLEKTKKALSLDMIPQDEDGLYLFTDQFNREYERFRKRTQNEESAKLGVKPSAIELPEKTELQKASQTYYNNRTTLEQQDPRGHDDRQAMREIVVRARDILKQDTGTDITNADFQALIWYAEKQFFEQLGVQKGRGDDNDYLDGAIYLLQSKGIENDQIKETLPEADGGRVYSRTSPYGADGQLRSRVTGGLEIEGTTEQDPNVTGLDETDAIYDFIDPKLRADVKEEGSEIKYSILGGMFARDPSLEFVDRPVRGLQTKFGDVLGNIEIARRKREARNNPAIKLFGLVEDISGKLNHVVVQEGLHTDLGGGKYGGFGLAHIRGRRFNKDGRPILTHSQEILRNHNYESDLDAIQQMLSAYKTQRNNFAKPFYDEARDNMGIRVEPDGGIGNNDLRIEWTRSRTKDGSENKLVMSLKYDNTTLKKGGMFGKPVQTLPLYTVRTIFSTPQQSEKRKRSQISSTPVNVTSPNSAQIAKDIQAKRQKIRYDNLSGIIAKGLGFTMPQDEAKLKAQRFLTYFQDAMLPVGALMDKLRSEGLTITDAMDTYMQEERYQGIAGSKVEAVQKDLFVPMMEKIRKLNISDAKIAQLKAIKGPVDLGFFAFADEKYASQKLAIMDTVLYAQHALERNDYIRKKTNGQNNAGSGMTDREATEINNWVKSLSLAERGQIENVVADVRNINENTIDARIEAGLLPKDTKTRDRSDPDAIIIYDNYVPLQGDLDIEQEKILYDEGYGRKRRISNYFGIAGKLDKTARGRKYDNYAQNIIASLMAQNNNTIAKGERNKVGLSFLNLIRGQEEQADGSVATNATLATEMNKIGEDITGQSVQDRRGKGINSEDELEIRENGQKRIIHIKDARIARALNGSMNPHQSNKLIRFMGKLNRYLSAINTTYNPSFVIPNFFRDLETAGVNVQQYDEKGLTKEVTLGAGRAVIGIVRELRNRGSNDPWAIEYRKFEEAGGKNATNQMSDLQDIIENTKGLLDDVSENTIKGKFGLQKQQFIGKNINSLLNVLDNVNTAVENGVRVATFKALRERGMTATQAAQAARNVTVNFAKGGENKVAMNSLYLFYNASLQGSMALINAAIRSPKVRKLWGGMVVYGIFQDQINSLFSGDEDGDGIKDYDELPRYILEHNLIIPTFGLAEDKFLSIPLGYGLNMAVNFGRALSRTQRGEYTAGEATRTIVGTAVESLSPIGAFDHFLTFASPTVADPFISLYINEDYKGDPIYKESPTFASVPKPNSQQYWSNTGRIPKFIADQLNTFTGGDEVEGGFIDMSPDIIEYWIDYLTGGAGRFVQRTAEMPFNIMDALNGDLEVSLWSTVPFARKVVVAPSERQDTGNYLDNRQDLFTILARVDLAKRSGDREAVIAMYDKYKKELSIAGRLKAIDNARNRIIRQIREIEKNPRIPEETKRNLIRLRRDKIKDLQQTGLILMRSVGFKKAG